MPEKPPHPAPPTPHVFHYTVDGEPQETSEHQLTVRQILENAGLKPTEEYYLVEWRGKNEVRHEDLNESIHIHEGMEFTAVKRGGPTPVS